MGLDEAEQAYTDAAQSKRIADGDLRMVEAKLRVMQQRAQDAWNAEQEAGERLLSMLRGEPDG